MEFNKEEIHLQALDWIKEAGVMLRASFKNQIKIDFKSNPHDLVTNMDKKVEQFFMEQIKSKFPHHHMLGEEGFGDTEVIKEGIVWLVDPIDGTMNFVHQHRNFAISIGVYVNGVGKVGYIYDVMGDELFYAIENEGAFLNDKPLPKLPKVQVPEAMISLNPSWVVENPHVHPHVLANLVRDMRGTRAYGSAALELAYVAAGRLDGYMSMRLAPWDYSAGLVILKEVGAVVSTVHGNELIFHPSTSLFAAKPGLHEEVVERYLKQGIKR